MLNAFRLAVSFLICLTIFHINANPDTIPNNLLDQQHEPVKIELVSENSTIEAGHPLWIAVHFSLEETWHAYWKNPGDAGMPPNVTWNLPDQFEVRSLLWPTPIRFNLGSSTGFGYEKDFTLLAEIIPSQSFSNEPIEIGANIDWLVCSDAACLPGHSEISLKLPTNSSNSQKILNAELFKNARRSIPQIIKLADIERRESLIELTFNDPYAQNRSINKIDFFPESRETIDYNAQTAIEKQNDIENQYTIILKDAGNSTSLKGLLILHTSNGQESYAVDTPIQALQNEQTIVGMSTLLSGDTKQNSILAESSSFSFEGGVALALVFAFIGGMLLNLMPCVLPVISIKALSFVKLAGKNRKLVFQHGLAFSFGVLLSFWILAALLITLQGYGQSVGWGFQLQEPIFVAILAAFIFIFALSLFGVFEMGTSLIGAAGSTIKQGSSTSSALIGSFLSGVLATAVATPCTGPFLGSAVGFAVTLPAPQALLIFTSLGIGMSSPYLALAGFPKLLQYLPKPGPWMITFKELMGFLMLATVVWLIWVFGAETNNFAVSTLLAGFFILSLASWIYGRWATPLTKKNVRIVGRLLALLFFSLGSYIVIIASSSFTESIGSQAKTTNEIGFKQDWEEFSPERVAELRKKGIPVFIDFTAKWCLICQANHLILTAEEVSQTFTSLGVVRMKADWTKNDAVIASELRKFGRNSVPLYVLYGTDSESKPQILPQVLTAETVLKALKEIETAL